MKPRVKLHTDNFRVVDVPYSFSTDAKGNPIDYRISSVLEAKRTNSLGEVYFCSVPEASYDNLANLHDIISTYQAFLKEIK